jgi:hypothetical protein
LSYNVPGKTPGGEATGHAKWAGRRPDPKFDDYPQNSRINLKITVELEIFSHFVKFWLN